MMVERIEDPGEAWDEFAERTEGAQLAHASAWAGVIQDAYGIVPHYLVARSATGEPSGILPLVRFRNLRGRRELISLPFHDAAGMLSECAESRSRLLESALELARQQGCSALELRQAGPIPEVPDGESSTPRIGLVLPLEADEDAQWKALRAKVRNQVRKAEREGLRLGEGSTEQLLDDFYAPFAVNMRDLGSPVHSRRFFAAAAARFGNALRFIVARDGSRSVGGLVAIHFAGRVTVTWASTLRSERKRCPNNLIYWEALRWAVERGASEFDFGRSPVGGGTFRFKKGWGAEERPLVWSRLGRDGALLPSPQAGESSALRRLSVLWTHLPVPLAVSLGSRLRGFLAN